MDFKETTPIYMQIAQTICDSILQGDYAAEGRVPSVREYAADVEVNVNTVVRSYDYLQQQQILFNKRGLGYFVAADARKRIVAIRKARFYNEELPAFFRQLKSLDIPMDDVLERFKEYH